MAKIKVNLSLVIDTNNDDIDNVLEELIEHVEETYSEYDSVEDVEVNTWEKKD